MQMARAGTLSHALFPQQTWVRHVALVFVASGVLAASAQIDIRIPSVGPVPITGQTFAVLMIGALLGPRLGFAAGAVYVIEGIARLPVYAGGASGWGVITGASGGYLLSYPFACFVVGWLAEKGWDRRPAMLALAMVAGEVVIYAFGLPWLWLWAEGQIPGADLNWTLRAGLIPFIPGDIAKLLLAAGLVPSGWHVLQTVHFGPRRVLSGEGAPATRSMAPEALIAGITLAAAALLPWRSGELGIESAAGGLVLVAGLVGALGAALRLRHVISAGIGQIIGYAAAALGGILAFVNLVDITATGDFEIADLQFGVALAMVASIALLAFTAVESGHQEPSEGAAPDS